MPGGVKIAAISTGCLHSLALTPKGEVLAWATTSTASWAMTARTKATSRSGSTCRAPSRPWPWPPALPQSRARRRRRGIRLGNNQDGQLGDGQPNLVNILPVEIFIQLRGVGKVVQIYGGCEHTLALTSKGEVLAWGDDAEGELGLIAAQDREPPSAGNEAQAPGRDLDRRQLLYQLRQDVARSGTGLGRGR